MTTRWFRQDEFPTAPVKSEGNDAIFYAGGGWFFRRVRSTELFGPMETEISAIAAYEEYLAKRNK